MNGKRFFCFFVLFSLIGQGAFAQENKLTITSPAFEHNQMIPQKYTCQGADINPPLEINSIPEGTQSLVLIVDDPDAPMGTWDHWIVYNIQPVNKINENSIPGTQAQNSFKKFNYGGPCPPRGTHRYFFKLYALDMMQVFKKAPSKKALEASMQGHILEQSVLIGLYAKQ